MENSSTVKSAQRLDATLSIRPNGREHTIETSWVSILGNGVYEGARRNFQLFVNILVWAAAIAPDRIWRRSSLKIWVRFSAVHCRDSANDASDNSRDYDGVVPPNQDVECG